jgi:hypothetical protein
VGGGVLQVPQGLFGRATPLRHHDPDRALEYGGRLLAQLRGDRGVHVELAQPDPQQQARMVGHQHRHQRHVTGERITARRVQGEGSEGVRVDVERVREDAVHAVPEGGGPPRRPPGLPVEALGDHHIAGPHRVEHRSLAVGVAGFVEDLGRQAAAGERGRLALADQHDPARDIGREQVGGDLHEVVQGRRQRRRRAENGGDLLERGDDLDKVRAISGEPASRPVVTSDVHQAILSDSTGRGPHRAQTTNGRVVPACGVDYLHS